MNLRFLLPLALLASCAAPSETARAPLPLPDIKVLSAVVMRPVLPDIASDFERTTGHKVAIDFATAGVLRDRIRAGEVADVTILPRPTLDALLKEGKLVAASDVVVGYGNVGVAVRAGAPRPDVSSVEGFKRSLLAAKSVVYADPAQGGASGIHFARVLERLGIAEQMKPKTKLIPGAGSGEVVARGEGEIAISGTMDLVRVPGADYVGPLPAELQNKTDFVYVAAVVANSRHPEEAKALIRSFLTPSARATIKSKGMEPG